MHLNLLSHWFDDLHMILQVTHFKQREVNPNMNYGMNWIKADFNQGQRQTETWA